MSDLTVGEETVQINYALIGVDDDPGTEQVNESVFGIRDDPTTVHDRRR